MGGWGRRVLVDVWILAEWWVGWWAGGLVGGYRKVSGWVGELVAFGDGGGVVALVVLRTLPWHCGRRWCGKLDETFFTGMGKIV